MAAIDNFVAAKNNTQQVNIAQQGSIAMLFCIFMAFMPLTPFGSY